VISESILEGTKVRLRPLEERDLPMCVVWMGDREVTRWLAAIDEPPTLEEERQWYERRRSDPDSVMWGIETLRVLPHDSIHSGQVDGRLVGNVELRLTPAARRAEIGIVVGEKSEWSKGIGTDTVRLVLRYAFQELGLNRVELTTDEDNARAIRCYEKCGFAREGLLRQHRLIDGEFGNTLVMAILRADWAASNRSKELGARS
jgi:RimJ/RimL family protein N-acetyltransferase